MAVFESGKYPGCIQYLYVLRAIESHGPAVNTLEGDDPSMGHETSTQLANGVRQPLLLEHFNIIAQPLGLSLQLLSRHSKAVAQCLQVTIQDLEFFPTSSGSKKGATSQPRK